MRSWIGWAGVAGRAAWVPAARGERDPQRFWLSVLADMTEFLDVRAGGSPTTWMAAARWWRCRTASASAGRTTGSWPRCWPGAGYRVASADLRGHGESSMGWPSITCTDIVGDLLLLTTRLGWPAVIVGHSARSRSSNRRSERPPVYHSICRFTSNATCNEVGDGVVGIHAIGGMAGIGNPIPLAIVHESSRRPSGGGVVMA